LIALFLALALLLANQGLNAIERELRQRLGDTLASVNQSAEQSLQLWTDTRLREAAYNARNPELLPLVSALEAHAADPASLVAAPEVAVPCVCSLTNAAI
jgi:hypothetical protein